MNVNLLLLLCIALIFAADSKVDGDAQAVTNSNLTDSRSDSSEIVADHSKNDTQLGDGSKPKGIEGDVNKKSDDSESNKEEAKKSNNSQRKKEEFHSEECDPSNMCIDELAQFVACLRVPGNDSPHLSLLIQNKANGALIVSISAPGFVRLEKNQVQLLENQDTEVKVYSIKNNKKGGSNDSTIILTSSKGHCSLELKDLVTATQETGNNAKAAVSRLSIFNIRPRTLIVILMISFLVLSLVIIPIVIHICRNKSQGDNKYQRLDMELPVSSPGLVTKSDREMGDDGWNNNWGSDWEDEKGDGDEEEQSHTPPVLPLTPSLSSRGLASRRLSKDGWKD